MKHSGTRLMFVLGIVFILAGFVLLLWNLGGVELLFDLGGVIPLVLGLVLIVRFYRNRARAKARFLFLGYMLVFVSALILLANNFWPDENGPWIDRLWPLFVGFTGLSFIPVAFNYHHGKRINLLIPSWVLLVLSFLALVFSLEWVNIGLAAFVGRWWPVFLLILGGSLVLAYWLHRYSNKGDQ